MNIQTVKEYIYSICRSDEEKNQVNMLLSIIEKKELDGYHIYNKDFTKYISYPLRNYFNVKIKYDFSLPCLLSNHFVLRLLNRYKNHFINYIMEDIKRALDNRHNNILFIGNGIIELYGLYNSIVYSNINNILLTIIPYSSYIHDEMNLQRYYKSYRRMNRKNNGYNKKKRIKISKYNKIIRTKQSRNFYM